MKALSSCVLKTLQAGSSLKCADNSGAKILEIISVKHSKCKRRSRCVGGVGDLVSCRVKTGTEKVRHQVFNCVIIRQRKEYRRVNGLRVFFEDNAAVVVREDFSPQGTEIKGPVAREAVLRFPTVGKLAGMVV